MNKSTEKSFITKHKKKILGGLLVALSLYGGQGIYSDIKEGFYYNKNDTVKQYKEVERSLFRLKDFNYYLTSIHKNLSSMPSYTDFKTILNDSYIKTKSKLEELIKTAELDVIELGKDSLVAEYIKDSKVDPKSVSNLIALLLGLPGLSALYIDSKLKERNK